MLFGLVCFFASLFQVSVLSRGWGGGGGGWVGEHGNKANSAEAEAEAWLGLAELGNKYIWVILQIHFNLEVELICFIKYQ